MDSDLKFHSHTSAVVNEANQVLGLIMKSLLYKSLVRPHLEYANVVNVNKIKSVQRQATRYVQNISNLPYSYHERLTYLNLPT